MKKALKVFIVTSLAVLYICTVADFSVVPSQEDTSENQKHSKALEFTLAEFSLGVGEVSVSNYSFFAIQLFPKLAKTVIDVLRTIKLQIRATFSQYLYYSRKSLFLFEKYDIIFPFHYFF